MEDTIIKGGKEERREEGREREGEIPQMAMAGAAPSQSQELRVLSGTPSWKEDPCLIHLPLPSQVHHQGTAQKSSWDSVSINFMLLLKTIFIGTILMPSTVHCDVEKQLIGKPQGSSKSITILK